MNKKADIKKIFKAQQKIILLCFIVFLWQNTSFGQVRFIKTFHNSKNYTEFAKKLVEIDQYYYIPIITGPTTDTLPNQFYIVKLDKKGNIVKRRFFDNWDEDRGDLFEANDNKIWKQSSGFDTIDYYYFIYTLLDDELNELQSVRVPKTFPKLGWPIEEVASIKLANGDYIFMQGVAANVWKPFQGEINGNNFIFLSKDGKLKANKTYGEFEVTPDNRIWQLNDSSIITIVYLNGCKKDCSAIKVLDFNGNVLSTKTLKIDFTKKCGKRYYGFREWASGKYSMVCLDESNELIYEKKIPENIHVRQFWDTRDNTDFRVRVIYEVIDPIGNPTGEYYETMMDTSFTWQKVRMFSEEENDGMKDIMNTLDVKDDFYPTSDGGALHLYYKVITVNYDNDIIVVKVDTNYTWCGNFYSEKDKNVIYPNPNIGNRLFLETDTWETISVYDFSGIKIRSYENTLFNAMDGIDIQNLRNGNYYLQIKFPDKIVYNKFIRY